MLSAANRDMHAVLTPGDAVPLPARAQGAR